MKTSKMTVPLDADLMLQLDRIVPGYKNAGEIWNLYKRWLFSIPPVVDRFTGIYFGILFMFECGRIYGIQQERARRKARRA